MLKIAILASGSTGNCAVASDGVTHVLLDAGISAKRIHAGLRELGLSPADLSAVLVTHAHGDHVSGLRVLARGSGIPIFATPPACEEWYRRCPCAETRALFRLHEAGSAFEAGSLAVRSFPTPHDAAGSVGYVLSGGGSSLALCTDLGRVTGEVRQAAAGCGTLVCEANHDLELLKNGPYPYVLKRRILGQKGHLSNEEGAELAAYAAERGTKAVVLAHLSRTNNTPKLAYGAAAARLRAMGREPGRDISLCVAPESAPSPRWLEEEAVIC